MWSRDELSALRKAVHEVPSSIEKQERWRRIAGIVATRGKRECWDTYKALKDEKASRNRLETLQQPDAKDVRPETTATSAGSDDLDDLLDQLHLGGSKPEERKESRGEADRANGAAEAKHSVDNPASGVRLGRGVLRPCSVAESKGSSENDYSKGGPFNSDASTAINSTGSGGGPKLAASSPAKVMGHENVTMAQAVAIRALLFNDPKKVLPDSWKRQGFVFSRAKELGFGLVQRAGGPCGVLASVQAFILAELLFPADSSPVPDFRAPSPAEQQVALVAALSRMIFAASGSSGRCFVFLPGKGACMARTSAYSPDGVTEKLQCWELAAGSRSSLEPFLGEHLRHFTDPDGCGVVLLLYSAIMTRGVAAVKADMDEGFAGEVRTLLDRHAYMAQEGVNLLLVGRACSNVFDGDRTLSDEGSSGDAVRLSGIPRRGAVGFLTLLEAYNYLDVGSRFKEPEVPVWVVFSESHYSVLFGLDPRIIDGSSGARFVNVFYWDGLAKQREEIKLTLVLDHDEELPDVDDAKALIPPLDLVCRTKWRGALVDWNGAEEIL